MAITTTKLTARILSSLLPAYGVKDVVLSPGSRNAPLIVALGRNPLLTAQTVVDERSAAFIALGIAIQSRRPVAVVCTSGSALLNYAPAVAEAYYRHVPLIVVSADRPEQWIDRDDSQTIRQQGVLANIVKRSVNLSADLEVVGDGARRANLLINEALTACITGEAGPVHINVAFDTPLAEIDEFDVDEGRYIPTIAPTPTFPTAEIRQIGMGLAERKVLIVCGFMPPDSVLNRAMLRIAAKTNIVVLAEATSNVHAEGVISSPGRLTYKALNEEFTPDVVISCGGSLVNADLKTWLRRLPQSVEHWRVDMSDTLLDTFSHLTRRFALPTATFFRQLASALHPYDPQSNYAQIWHKCLGMTRLAEDFDRQPFKAVISLVPANWNVHFSNGMTIRYAQTYDCARLHRCESNRGVSGIDGSVSTALGASLAYKAAPTVLLTGDMSMQYDIAALSSQCLTPRLKIVVFDNHGGGIFRQVAACRLLPEVEERFTASTAMSLPLQKLAEAYDFAYFQSDSIDGIKAAFREFARENARPAILHIKLL